MVADSVGALTALGTLGDICCRGDRRATLPASCGPSGDRVHDSDVHIAAAPRARLTIDRAMVTRLGLWYFALLLPTLYFKRSALDAMYEEGISAALDARGVVGLHRLGWWLIAAQADIWQVFVAVLVLAAVGRGLLRIAIPTLAALSVLVAMLISAANWLSFVMLGTLLDADNLRIAIDWGRANPGDLARQGNPKLVAGAVAALILLLALWTVATYLIVRFAPTEPRPARVARWAPVAALLTLAMASGPRAFASRDTRLAPVVERGYWGSTFSALGGSETWRPRALQLPSDRQIIAEFRALTYPDGRDRQPRWMANPASLRRVPRHVILISLETAPRQFYRIVDNPRFPTFYRMGSHGIGSDHHYSPVPATTWALFTMLSGTYPRIGRPLLDYGDFRSDGVAAVLGQRGFETTFIDSYRIDWQVGPERSSNRRMLGDLGMAAEVEATATDSLTRKARGAYEMALAHDRRSLQLAGERVLDASAHGHKAMVVIATILGHFPWKSPERDDARSGPEKLDGIAQALDMLVGGLLDTLAAHGLADSTIVVVTGDHGFRARTEFSSVGAPLRFGQLSFNVPFLLYAPGLFDGPVRLPYTTSHVDIAPTLLALEGIDPDSLLLHGENMLDARLTARTVFLLNGLVRPVDGYRRGQMIVSLNRLTREAEVTPDNTGVPRVDPALLPEAERVLGRASDLFDRTAAAMVQRVTPRPAP